MTNNILQLQRKLEVFSEGRELSNDEFILKFARFSKLDEVVNPFGFLSKLNKKDNAVPKRLKTWGLGKIYVVVQDYCTGWKVVDHRSGQSQDWTVVQHPDGYQLEIYSSNFFNEILHSDTIVNGVLQGSYKWNGNTLLRA